MENIMTKKKLSVWEALSERLTGELWVRSNQGPIMVELIAPDKDELEALNDELPKPSEPKESDLKVIEDHQASLDKRENEFTYRLLDLGLVHKPDGDLDKRLAYYKKLSNPIVGTLVAGIYQLMLHQKIVSKREDVE